MTIKDRKKGNGGFTLVEFIVVLVILAILAATLIPSLAGYIDRANDRAAIAECRSCVMAAQTLASERYAANQTLTLDDSAAILALADLPDSCDILVLRVPNGKVSKLVFMTKDGIFVTYLDGVYTIGNLSSINDPDTLEALKDAFDEKALGLVDSGAQDLAGTRSFVIKALLAEKHIDFEALGATSWQYRRTAAGEFFLWTPTDISAIALTDASGNSTPAAKNFPVLRYDFKTDTYAVCLVNLTTSHSNDELSETKTEYNVLGSQYAAFVNYGYSAALPDSERTYENALLDYNAALAEYNAKLNP